MKIYRFAVHPAEEKYYFIECLNDPALFTQARSMDEVVMMARDVVASMYEFDKKDILIELVIPPDVKTKYDIKVPKENIETQIGRLALTPLNMESIIFCGIQASGKTTFYQQRFFDTHIRLSLDLVKTRHREDALLFSCLAAQIPFVIDNTNPSPKTRARYLHLSKAAGYRCVLYYFEAAPNEALLRNAARTGRFRVPDIAIQGTYAKLTPPTTSEGFDTAYNVRLSLTGDFSIQEIT